tara:strand:- start:212119 stop:212463 length:345 start_codon:yes stop_codon:yes gene_type:complete
VNDKFDPNNLYEKLRETKNAVDKPHFQTTPEEVIQVKIRPDDSIAPGLFKPDPLIPGGYKANKITIAAMRKDIFVAGQEIFEDLEDIINCASCNKELDRQFWYFCPYCERKFST